MDFAECFAFVYQCYELLYAILVNLNLAKISVGSVLVDKHC